MHFAARHHAPRRGQPVDIGALFQGTGIDLAQKLLDHASGLHPFAGVDFRHRERLAFFLGAFLHQCLVLGHIRHALVFGFERHHFVVMVGALYYKIAVWKKKFSGDGGWELDLVLLAILLLVAAMGSGVFALNMLS